MTSPQMNIAPWVTALVCIQEFTSFGKSVVPGDIVSEETAKSWPPGTLESRLTNKFLKYDTMRPQGEPSVAAQEAIVAGTNYTAQPELLEKFSKREIVQAVEKELGLAPGGTGIDPDRLSKPDVLIAAKTMLAERNANNPPR